MCVDDVPENIGDKTRGIKVRIFIADRRSSPAYQNDAILTPRKIIPTADARYLHSNYDMLLSLKTISKANRSILFYSFILVDLEWLSNI